MKTIAIQQKELDELNARVAAVGKEIKKDPLKMQSLALHEKKFELNGIKKGITDDIEAFNKESGPVDKARLLEQVKEDNIEIIAMESKITELEAQSVKLTDQIKQMEKELDSSKQSGILYTYTEKNSKFEELLRRDKEMTLFLDNFESRMAESTNRNTETQESIVSLLQKIDELSKLDVQNLPSAKEVQELKGDVNFKEKELKNSENTAEGLLAERERRLKDLEKVQQLEAKIDTELNQLREKKLNLITEMKKVGNIEQVRKETEELKMKNINDRDKLKAERESLTASVAALSSKYDAKTAELNDNETYTLLASLEQKIKHISSNNDRLNETLASKMAESDYKTIAAAALKLGDEVNHQLISMLRI